MRIEICQFLYFILILLGFVDATSLLAKEKPTTYSESKHKRYLLPLDHPAQEQLKLLFTSPEIFDNRINMQAAGFTFFGHYSRKLLVCTHPLLSDYVVKKFINLVPSGNQLSAYVRRLKGRKKISRYIKSAKVENLVVPKKYLYELPENFSDPVTHEKSYILIAEKQDLCSVEETKQRYYGISRKMLKELCLFLLKFPGMDSSLENLSFTKEGKVALIDTDKWEEQRSEYLRRIIDELSERNKKYAKRLKKKYS